MEDTLSFSEYKYKKSLGNVSECALLDVLTLALFYDPILSWGSSAINVSLQLKSLRNQSQSALKVTPQSKSVCNQSHSAIKVSLQSKSLRNQSQSAIKVTPQSKSVCNQSHSAIKVTPRSKSHRYQSQSAVRVTSLSFEKPEVKPAATAALNKPKQSLRPGYNPLSGDDSGACYRPARRGGAGGGG
nr:hypothetical protein BgiMline_028064 [Biomphalaria glabrata]